MAPVLVLAGGENLSAVRAYTSLLATEQCHVVEGLVHVLFRQPRSGRAPSDRVRIGDRCFEYSYFTSTLANRRTIARGGALTEGARARVHHGRRNILKVEVAD